MNEIGNNIGHYDQNHCIFATIDNIILMETGNGGKRQRKRSVESFIGGKWKGSFK